MFGDKLQGISDYRKDDVSSGDEYDSCDDYDLQSRTWNILSLKSLVKQMKLVRPRSLAWAILLEALPATTPELLERLKEHRDEYDTLKGMFSKDPRLDIGDDPLSQKDESLWHQHFCDNELKALILQDVVRTFPDESFFRKREVQDLMVRVLFVWARTHPKIGYRQGMHEILAPILYELYLDRKYASKELSPPMVVILKEDYIENDSHMLFTALMKGLEEFYATGDVVPSRCGRLPTSNSVHSENEVVRYLNRIREEHLIPLDHELATHLSNCNISLELFGIRWLRLLFGREFLRSELSNLWSFLFCEGPDLPQLHFVLLAILISMRNTLLDPDPGVVLSALMRPVGLNVGHIIAFTLHLSQPLVYPRPVTPPPMLRHKQPLSRDESLEERGVSGGVAEGEGESEGGEEGVAEGADVARELATLAVVRAQLPALAAALRRQLDPPPPALAHSLHRLQQLSSLVQCRNHALVDVETALEANENESTGAAVRRQLVPIRLVYKTNNPRVQRKPADQPPKEVALKVFNETECPSSNSDLPFLDPLGLRTE